MRVELAQAARQGGDRPARTRGPRERKALGEVLARIGLVPEGDRFPAIVRAKNTVGVQFHPEKSSAAGLAFLSRTLAEPSWRIGERT